MAWHWAPILYPFDLDGDEVDDLFGVMEAGTGVAGPERFDIDSEAPDQAWRLLLLRRDTANGQFEDVTNLIDHPWLLTAGPQIGLFGADGDPDFMFTTLKQIELYLGTAQGGLRRAGRIFHSGNGAFVSVGDIDGDGDDDVVATTPGNVGGVVDLHLNPGIAPLPSTRALLASPGSTRPNTTAAASSASASSRARKHPLVEGTSTLGDGPTAWVTSPWERSLYAIDLGASPPELSGPYLAEQLGAPGLWIGGIDDLPGTRSLGVADQRFQRGWVSIVDVSTPAAPNIGAQAEQNFSGDLAISATADLGFKGGFGFYSMRSGLVAGPSGAPNDLINWQGHAPAWPAQGTIDIATANTEIACVAIAPDRRTVIFCDQKGNRIVFGDFQFGGLDPSTWNGEAALATSGQPQNIAIGPDGTVLVAIAVDGSDAVDVFKVTAPGVVVAGTPASITGLPGNQQSIAIEPDGTKAWVLSVGPSPDTVSRIAISAPGVAALDGAALIESPNDAIDGWLVGIEALAIDPAGEKLVISGASISVTDTEIAVVDLDSLAVTVLDTGVVAPAGVAIVPGRVVFRDGFNGGDYCGWDAPTAGCP